MLGQCQPPELHVGVVPFAPEGHGDNKEQAQGAAACHAQWACAQGNWGSCPFFFSGRDVRLISPGFLEQGGERSFIPLRFPWGEIALNPKVGVTGFTRTSVLCPGGRRHP